jgi:hypothetical protein
MAGSAGGSDNIATGTNALYGNTSGSDNLASGTAALFANGSGSRNLALGSSALTANTTGARNYAAGFQALRANTTGTDNLATGSNTLQANTTGSRNLGAGTNALAANSKGRDNTASGFHALEANTSGSFNVALGTGAGANLTTGSNNVEIANAGVAGEAKKIRIGTVGTQNAAFLAGVDGASIAGPTQSVLVNANGQLGTATASSRALKRDVRPLGRAASRRLLSLRPVSYRYRDGDRRRQFGLIAERVAGELPALVERKPNGKPAGVYYQELPALLLAEVKRQQREIERLRGRVTGRN